MKDNHRRRSPAEEEPSLQREQRFYEELICPLITEARAQGIPQRELQERIERTMKQ